MQNYLSHHGILGQKWGVRRFQNKDGSLTSEGLKRQQARRNVLRNRPYTDDVNEIVKTLSSREKSLLGASQDEDRIPKDQEDALNSTKLNTFLTKYEDIPISFVEIWVNQKHSDVGQIALATRNDPNYRGKGYASRDVKRAIDWADRYGNMTLKELEWWVEKSNTPSINLAKKYGFTPDPEWDDPEYDHCLRDVKKRKNT